MTTDLRRPVLGRDREARGEGERECREIPIRNVRFKGGS